MSRLFFIILLCLPAICAHAQGREVQLKPGAVSYSPTSFYISDVVDDRTDKTVGLLKNGSKKDMITLHGGAAAVVKQLCAVPHRKDAQPVVLHIAALNYSLALHDSAWHGTSEVTFAFYAADRKVIDYTSKGEVQITKPTDYVEKFLREELKKDLKKFDAWWPQHKNNIPTNDAVKVDVTIGKTTDKPNIIVYSRQRQLQISDFKGPVRNGVPEKAETASGMVYYSYGKTENGQVVLYITIIPTFDMSKSWFNENGNSLVLLAHEQTHFTITAIKVCELVQAIRTAHLTQENYEAKLQELQKQSSDASVAEQAAYDAETNHGTIEAKQHEWEQRIGEKIKKVGCY